MKLPNGYGSVYKLSGNRRKPWAARVTAGIHEISQTRTLEWVAISFVNTHVQASFSFFLLWCKSYSVVKG